MQDTWSNSHRTDTSYHPTFGWLYVPNQLKRMPDPTEPYYIRTNAEGFRSNFDFDKRSQGKKRIIFIGDSFAAGDGVANEDRFSDLVTSSIGNLECYNFGLTASGTDQQVLIYERIAKHFDHDIVILGFSLHDITRLGPKMIWRGHQDRLEYLLLSKPYFYENGRELRLGNVPVPRPRRLTGRGNNDTNALIRLVRRVYELSGRSAEDLGRWTREAQSNLGELLLSYRIYKQYGQYYDDLNEKWHLMELIIEQLVADSDDKTVIFFPIPEVRALSSVFTGKFQPLFGRLEKEHDNVIFLDIAGSVKNYARSERHNMMSMSTSHFTKRGNFIASALIRECLINNGLV